VTDLEAAVRAATLDPSMSQWINQVQAAVNSPAMKAMIGNVQSASADLRDTVQQIDEAQKMVAETLKQAELLWLIKNRVGQ
jgi:methyl-accepting chemotaxis protein